MKKIYIIGPVGSGKTTLAKKISSKLNIKMYELDKIVWNDDENIKRTDEEVLKIFNEIIKQDSWIIEDVGRTIFIDGLKMADIVYYIDLKPILIYKRCVLRWIKQKIGTEPYNYKPTIKGLIQMIKWARQDIKNKKIDYIKNNTQKYKVLKRKDVKNIGRNMNNCTFCNMDKTKLANTILDETKHFYVTPSLGSLTEGYILITSKRHINSMSELNIEEIEEYKILIKKYRKIFKSIYKKYPIVFEHGTPNFKDEIKVSSVVHAHTHIVNHNYKNEKILLQKLNFNKIDNIEDIDLNKNYIFYINPNNEIYVTYNFEPVSQIMRIEIAKDLNLLDKYDWRKNNFDDNIILTINKINDLLKRQ